MSPEPGITISEARRFLNSRGANVRMTAVNGPQIEAKYKDGPWLYVSWIENGEVSPYNVVSWVNMNIENKASE